MDLESLKHKELQSLCKSANIKAAGKVTVAELETRVD
jgi:hypothetical protein